MQFAAPEQSNPLGCKLSALTTVTPDVDASIDFYAKLIGMTQVDEGVLPNERRFALMVMEGSDASAIVRIVQAPDGARPNRVRPTSGPADPGLMVMEGRARDPAESYHRLASAGVPMISPPRYYYFRNVMGRRSIDVMSYAPFGPGGEQLFLTARVLDDRHDWTFSGLHSGFHNVAITSLDQTPVNAFYEQAFGLRRTSQIECYQDNANELIGAPPGSYFLWGNLGNKVSIEIWDMAAESGHVYPTSLDRTGLAMMTLRVNDLSACRMRCKEAGIPIEQEGGLPMPGRAQPDGFQIRGAVGELVEVIGQ